MKKKLMLLALGALTALAMTALPSAASAGEFVATCSGGGTCEGKVESTGKATLEEESGLSVECSSTTGTVTAPNNSSTGTATLKFHGCVDEVLHTHCESAVGQPNGTIATNTMVTHLIYIDPKTGTDTKGTTPGVLLTAPNVTFKCPVVGLTKTVTGHPLGNGIIGHWENPECGLAKANHTIDFKPAASPTGTQKYEQVTTTGAMFNLIVNNSAGGAYKTASQEGTAHINWQGGKTVTFDC